MISTHKWNEGAVGRVSSNWLNLGGWGVALRRENRSFHQSVCPYVNRDQKKIIKYSRLLETLRKLTSNLKFNSNRRISEPLYTTYFCCIFSVVNDGVCLWGCGRQRFHSLATDEDRVWSSGVMILLGKSERTASLTFPSATFLITNKLSWEQTLAFMVRNRRLTSWAIK
jgi:hypothetical protein